MWFWIGLLLIFVWGSWGYLRRRWWLREIERSLHHTGASGNAPGFLPSGRYEPPSWLSVPDKVVTAAAAAAAIIGVFLVVGGHWGWFDQPTAVNPNELPVR